MAVVVTDFELEVLDPGLQIVIKPSDAALAQMGDFVREMHTGSGLLDVLAEGTTLEAAQSMVLDYVKEWVPEPRKAPLGGNTVATDRAFLARDMPELEQWVHYRNVDVSTIKELSKRWYPRVHYGAPKKAGNHRALADIQESIEELRYYREAVFVPPPGPAPTELRVIAERHRGTVTGAVGEAISRGH